MWNLQLQELLPSNALPIFSPYSVFLAGLVNSQSWSYLPIDISSNLNGLDWHFVTFDLATPVNHNDIILHLDSNSTVTGSLSITVFVESPHLKRNKIKLIKGGDLNKQKILYLSTFKKSHTQTNNANGES
jgi:hypothetical protein